MGILLDGVIVLLIVVCLMAWRDRAVSSALFSLASIAAALSAAVLFTFLLSSPVADHVFRPSVSRAAAYDLADLVSAPHLDTGEETVEAFSFEPLLEEGAASFAEILHQYGTSLDEVRNAYALSPSSGTVLKIVSRGMADMLAKVSLLAVFWVGLALLLRWGTRRIEDNLRPPKRLKGIRRLWPLLAALAAAVVIVWGGSLMLAWAVPYLEPRTLVLSRDMLDSAQIYTILNRINPFAWLCF